METAFLVEWTPSAKALGHFWDREKIHKPEAQQVRPRVVGDDHQGEHGGLKEPSAMGSSAGKGGTKVNWSLFLKTSFRLPGEEQIMGAGAALHHVDLIFVLLLNSPVHPISGHSQISLDQMKWIWWIDLAITGFFWWSWREIPGGNLTGCSCNKYQWVNICGELRTMPRCNRLTEILVG